MKTDFRRFLKESTVILDGGTGTLLQSAGLKPGELPERFGLQHPEVITAIHRSYFDAGSNVVMTNTFGASALKYESGELEQIIKSAIGCARAAQEQSCGAQPKWVALDIGPTGRMLKPYGDLDFEDAVTAFAHVARLGELYGADLIFIETMSDSYEAKAALLAAKEATSLPVLVSCAYGSDGKLMTGATPAATVAMLEGLGADAIGANCSLGPEALSGVVRELLEYASVPVIFKPNAGMPRAEKGGTVYGIYPDEFAGSVAELVRAGVRLAGGCCGTTPEYIASLVKAVSGIAPKAVEKKRRTLVSSYANVTELGKAPVLIGERINPTGKRRFKEALRARDTDYILNEALSQEAAGAHILDVNVGLPEIDEVAVLSDTVCRIQAISPLPLQIDTSNPAAMEAALRRYNGKAMINSVNGKAESMKEILPLAKKYGGVLVALTLDEGGIPDRAEGRLEIARKIVTEAEKYGIDRRDIVFDPLALTVSADGNAAKETLRAVRLIKEELGCHTSLGVSNVSFGLPERAAVNSSFFTLALGQGLSAAIMNPHSPEMMRAYHSYLALAGLDEGCLGYIKFCETMPKAPEAAAAAPAVSKAAAGEPSDGSELKHAIEKGLTEAAVRLTEEALLTSDGLEVVNRDIIPALDRVGQGFENKTVYLPSLLMSAEAAKASFGVIKSRMSAVAQNKCPIVIATVKGDIHDIGKNIVKLLLENYGFPVYDLGKDVPPEAIAEAAVKHSARIVGLSALMTTTVPAMADAIKLLREKAPLCRIMVGGAVLTAEYADMIGADRYAKDAMEAVRYAELINGEG